MNNPSLTPEEMEQFRNGVSMDAYFGETPIAYNEHMEIWEKIFMKNIINTDFNVSNK